MPVTIGSKPESTFADPIGLLGDCHRRIERFLAVLVKVAGEARGGPMSEDQRTACTTALRYFREAAPKHTADEEESLVPRLRAIDRPDVQTLLTKVASLEEDHVLAGTGHAEVDRLGCLWLAQDHLSPEQSARLNTVLGELAELYRHHIEIEDRDVFPLSAAVLSPADQKAIGAEMASRRNLI